MAPVREWREPVRATKPMLAAIADAGEVPLASPALVYEPKYDGVRAIAEVEDGRARLWSRNGADKGPQFPEVAAALATLGGPLVLDGEIVALDDAGEPLGFQALQDRIHLTRAADVRRAAQRRPAAFYAFDLLRDGGEDLRGLPLLERKARLARRLEGRAGATLRLGRWEAGDGRALHEEACARGWEGLVVKDARAPYRSGARGPEWRKLKLLRRQEFVVGGWTEPRGSREGLGALLVGVREGGALRYAGHVGTGFDGRALRALAARLAPLEIERCPFATRPPANGRPHWVRPEVVVEVKFVCWTEAKLLRHPVFLGVRDDARPELVAREAPPRGDGASDGGQALWAQLEAIERGRGAGRLRLPDGNVLPVTNLRKPFWPALGITKGELLRYYVTVAPLLLPVVADRPLVMRRFPDGVEGEAFYQHRAPDDPPPGVRVASLPDDDVPARLVGGDLATLVYMTQLAAVSQDPWFSRVDAPEHVEDVALDLDPMPGVPFARVLDVARWVRDEIERLGVPGHPKTSGATGLHVHVPLPPGTTYEAGRVFAQIVATLVATRHPKVATVERSVGARGATVYVDYLQNVRGKTLACAYSARASEYAGVSTPLTWREIDEGVDPRDFTVRTAPARFAAVGDLWAAVRQGPRADLRAALAKLGGRRKSPAL